MWRKSIEKELQEEQKDTEEVSKNLQGMHVITTSMMKREHTVSNRKT